MAFLVKSRDWAGQSIVAKNDISAGATLERAMIAFKRPAKNGLAPEVAEKILGRKLKRAIPQDEQIQLADFE